MYKDTATSVGIISMKRKEGCTEFEINNVNFKSQGFEHQHCGSASTQQES